MNNTSWEWNGSFEECLIENFDRTIVDCSNCYNLEETPLWVLVLHAVVILLIMIASFVSSGLILLLVAKYKKLRNHAVIVSLNIIFVDIGLVLSYHLPSFASVVAKDWPFGFIGCKLFGFFSIVFILLRWNMMGILAIDRFCTVRFPFSYKKYKKTVLIVLVSAAWFLQVLASTSVFTGFVSVAFRQNVPTCLFYAPTLDRGLIYSSIINTVSIAIGIVLPTVLYTWLYYRARKLRPSATKLGALSVEIAGSVISLPFDQHPLENGYRNKERRALATFALIFIGLFVTGLPGYSFQVIRSISVTVWCKIHILLHFIFNDVFKFVTVLDAIVILRDKDFREHLKLCLYCCQRTEPVVESDAAAVESEQVQLRSLTSLRSRTSSIVSLSRSNNMLPARNGTMLQQVEEEDEQVNKKFREELNLYYKNTTNSSKLFVVVSYRKCPIRPRRYSTVTFITDRDTCDNISPDHSLSISN